MCLALYTQPRHIEQTVGTQVVQQVRTTGIQCVVPFFELAEKGNWTLLRIVVQIVTLEAVYLFLNLAQKVPHSTVVV